MKWKTVATVAALSLVPFGYMSYLVTPRKEKPRGNGKKIVCIGDSITFGSGVAFTRNRDAWARILGRSLGEQYEVLNYGISGATLTKEGDQPYNPEFWEAAKDLQAQIYILMLGTNDSKPQNWNAQRYASQLDERIKELKSNPFVQTVYLMAPPPAYKKKAEKPYAAFNINGDILRDEIHDIVRECAQMNDVQLIDLYALMENHPEYMGDGVHPNRLGNKIIADYIFQRILKN